MKKISTPYATTKVGVTVLLTSSNQLLLAQRKGSHGAGTWDTPGGHLEPGETIVDCAIRETFEETGIQLSAKDIVELGFTEDFFEKEAKHYISCVVKCEIDKIQNIAMVKEPDKIMHEWEWHDLSNLPNPLFISLENALSKGFLVSI